MKARAVIRNPKAEIRRKPEGRNPKGPAKERCKPFYES